MIIFSLVCAIALTIFMILKTVADLTTDAPYIKIPEEFFEPLVNNLKLKDNSVLYDLGCGDAHILKKILIKYPNIKVVGVEKAVIPYTLAKIKTRDVKNITVLRQDIFNVDVSDATHIFVYLFPRVMEKLMPILDKKCKKGTKVISCDFEDRNRKDGKIINLNTLAKRGRRLIVYTI